MRTTVTILLILTLTFCMLGTAVASYNGWGLTPVGPSSVRSGSVGGPGVVGGGPGNGK